ncbi:hypothetical protein EHQ16_19310 [Leptospira kanakyensis]|uniref:Uncharacterized protein n=1 Tax=Leptospira kanakyensis TaxID=2484968 RepID=A0A6N4QAY9_9LEPT|nr:hypothetical protein [Leptospira kanakyensis]TGK54268.1 hypothetical protein EHQ11_03315 [Leptospira kanakyensis]TGK56379.1 hypothetical protein EHQ16_19310 [Leptospira kanakyensis]TGK77244.1 hypothetical protein EHQ18_00025 [Leptospira kanakyensis]
MNKFKNFFLSKLITIFLFLFFFNNCAALGFWVITFEEKEYEIDSAYKKKDINTVLNTYGEPSKIETVSDQCKQIIYRKGDIKIKYGGIGASYLTLLLTFPLILPYGYTYDSLEFKICDQIIEKEIRRNAEGHKFVGGLGFVCLPNGSNEKCIKLIGTKVYEEYRLNDNDFLAWLYLILVWGTIFILL